VKQIALVFEQGRYRALITRIVNESEDYKDVAGKFWLRLRSTSVRGKQPQYGWGYSYMSEIVDDDIKVKYCQSWVISVI